MGSNPAAPTIILAIVHDRGAAELFASADVDHSTTTTTAIPGLIFTRTPMVRFSLLAEVG
ncbi:MAG TPA: hypothetical protein VHA71_01275 [Rhodanobacteraceae bacterium]|nr:hypothetical protein [Rhodanobacteraceae bacterium]